MKIRGDLESLYLKTVKECVSLMEEECKHEQEQIRVALAMGEKIDHLVAGTAEGEAIIKNLARDIFKERKKIVAPSKLFEYRQLFLDFGSMKTVKSLAEKSLNDFSLDSLINMSSKGNGAGDKSQPRESDIVSVLEKALKNLNKAESMLEDCHFSENELTEVIQIMESVQAKAISLYKSARGDGGMGQMDFFRSAINSDRPGVA